MAKLALLDGHSLAYRAFYALPPDLATPSGQVTNAVFGFTSMLIKLMDDEAPDAIAVAWDRKEPTFRKEQYREYKANRETAPDLFRSQLPLIRDVLEAMEIPQVDLIGYEADDLIATLVVAGRKEGFDVVVVTGDRDAFQLSSADVTVLYTRRGISDTVHATPAWIVDRYGIGPDRYVEYAALRGDSSDNLPGVPGVGEKTAAKLINQYASLEELYDDLASMTPKLRENLEAARDQVFLNRSLMTMVSDAPIEEVAPSDLDLKPFDRDRVRMLFDELAFRSLWQRLEELGGVAAATHVLEDVEVTTATAAADINNFDGDALVVEPVWDDEALAGLVVAGDPAVYLPLEIAAPALSDETQIVVHDAKPLLRALAEADVPLPHIAFDSMLAAWLINPAQRAPDLEDLAYKELGIEVGSIDGGSAADDQGSFSFDEPKLDLETAARRAIAVSGLTEPLRSQMEARGATELYTAIELPLTRVLAAMEDEGIGLDVAFLTAFGEDLEVRIAQLQEDIHGLAGRSFNVNSTLQLREILFDQLGLPILKKTPKGAPSTDASVLEKLKGEHEIVEKLLAFRELDKLRSTYVVSLLGLVADDGRLHGRFNQTGAATGRLSMEQPNLQNIPARSDEGRAIREAFVTPAERSFLVADYSQIELRILAHLSQDPGMIEAFDADIDIHAATAARVNDVPLDAVTDDMRRTSKMINFGLLYGMEAYGLAQRLDIDRSEAQRHIDEYFVQFPDVRAYMAGIVDEARTTGYTTTILGRRRYLPELHSRSTRERQMGERMALNAPIQGSAADVIKKAMIELDGTLTAKGSQAAMLLQIHDELVIEIPDSELDEVTDMTIATMEGVVELSVPLKVSYATGRTLADAAH
ncbi:MAG: DNA polymerase I [Acidimicrobiia bacterium]